MMKNLSRLLVAVAGALAMSTAFAQSSSDTMQQPAQPGVSAGQNDSGSGGVMQGSADSGSVGPITRQEVRRELVQSEKNGQITSLDRTLYKGN
jgi:hypothetical protein